MEPILTRKQFDILTFLEKNKIVNLCDIANSTGMSLDSVRCTLDVLIEKGYVIDYTVTKLGYTALEPYKVKRAVFLAAGFGSRLVPVTLNTPKPLVRVCGTRMIDTSLDAVLAAGIEEIYIVRGYLGEQFDQLLYKYPMIRFIDNLEYNTANNISSAMCARHLFQNAYVLEADLVLYNPDLISKYQYTSNCLGVYVEATDDWCFETENGIITKMKIGGTDCHHVYGIYYWNAEDGAKLCEDFQSVYEMPDGKNRYWDLVPLEYCKDHYRVEVRNCVIGDIIEIDSYSELKKVDSAYC